MPSFDEIKNLLLNAWKIIDENGNGEIDFNEFKKWIENDDDIQHMMINYGRYQMVPHALKIYNPLMDKLMNLFLELLPSGKNIEYRALKNNSAELLKYQSVL